MQLSSRSSRSATAQSLYTGALTPASTRPPLRRALVCRAEGRAPPAPDRLLPAGRSAEAPLRSSIPALLEQLDGMTARLSALQSTHAASHSRLQAMHAELEASQAQLRQGLAFITVGVDQLGEEMSLLNHAGSGGTGGGSSPRRSPRSPYTKKLGRLLARELLAQRAQQAKQG